jgi:archaellum component FlaG (FlaF/FlaG flagellin family)
MRLSIIPLAAAIFASAAVAAPADTSLQLRDETPSSGGCPTSATAECCQTISDPNDPAVQSALGFLNIPISIPGLLGNVGLNCTFTAIVVFIQTLY